MNDRFRFRAYNRSENYYIYDAIYAYDGNNYNAGGDNDCHIRCLAEYMDRQEEYIVEQCTGLKDKNGRLIYEGDIVNILCEIEEQGVIEWEREEAQFVIRAEQAGFVANFDNYSGIDLEVIGNIHENTDLLEAENA